MTNRREFIRQVSTAGLAAALPNLSFSSPQTASPKIWAGLLHMSFNFAAGIHKYGGLRHEFEPDQSLWDDAIKYMAKSGMNMVVINVEDHILWDSHPEIAVKNAWTKDKLRQELAKIRALGLEPIPLLNFSTAHDAWLKTYERMVSSNKYREVCKNIIAEVIDVFDKPRLFHLGMDEETAEHQQHFDYVVVRKNELWWSDFYFLIDEVMRGGSRPWVWSDYYWHHPELFLKNMPKSVMQSNWYYKGEFDLNKLKNPDKARGNAFKDPVWTCVNTYIDLDKNGYDQIPTSSNDQGILTGIGNTVKFCTEHIDDSRLKGFLQTFWKPTTEQYRGLIMEGIDLMGNAKKSYLSKR